MQKKSKYAKPEWERRFLLREFPKGIELHRTRKILDRYIAGTTLRLRRHIDDEGEIVLKLTQKIPVGRSGALQGTITTMYLGEQEYNLLAGLPGAVLTKTRYSLPPFGIDVFDGALSGLILAEAEFDSETEASALTIPSFVVDEVSGDTRFEGGCLATASRRDVEAWVAEYGLTL
jgi:CYTH domain-containing protein